MKADLPQQKDQVLCVIELGLFWLPGCMCVCVCVRPCVTFLMRVAGCVEQRERPLAAGWHFALRAAPPHGVVIGVGRTSSS